MPRRPLQSLLPLAVLLGLIGSLITATPASAAPGDVDTTFGSGGSVVTDISGSTDRIQDLAIQADGKLVAAGFAHNGPADDFALARYTTAGALDTTFDTDGKVTTSFANTDDATAVAIQPDGKIVAAGYFHNGSDYDFALARYTTAGALDTTFDTDGKVTTAIGTDFDLAYAVAIQADGKIVAAGFSYNGSNDDFALVRYTSSGALDTTFGTGGKVTTGFGSFSEDEGLDMAIQGDGKIVVVGYSLNGSNRDFALARFTTSGALDTTFGTGGRVITNFGTSLFDLASAVAIQPDGKILAAGYTGTSSNYDFALARYTTTGALDSTFGIGGKVITDVGSIEDVANDVALQPDGKIVTAGYVLGSTYDFAAARYLPTGALDPSFGTGGEVVTAVGPSNDFGFAVALQSNGKIVLGGDSSGDFALVRYLGDPAPATVPVSIVSSPSPGAFSPSTAAAKPGDSVKWTNSTLTTHTTTGDAPLSYWDSGNLTFAQMFTQAFPVAGAYGYHCSIHPSMVGTVMVNPRAAPPSGSTASTFLITWANISIPSGFRADVIIKRPGAGWAAWMTNRSGTQTYAAFTPDAGAGTYQFAARFRKVATGSPATGWAGVGITVS